MISLPGAVDATMRKVSKIASGVKYQVTPSHEKNPAASER